MDVPRQEPSVTGRARQKQRTRTAIVDAARRLMSNGITPTVPDAAEAALVSRTTAYRYFPTQESLLLEVAVTIDVDDIERRVHEPARPIDGAVPHLHDVLDEFNRHVLDAEVQYRTSLRVYADLALEAIGHGDSSPDVREGRRVRWIESVLEPMQSEFDEDTWRRLVSALAVVAGTEAMLVLKDVCRLDADAALDVSSWAIDAILAHARRS